MISTHETKITKDISGKKLVVTREFNAPLEKVWKAWTESSLLDQWWAPKPYKTHTKSMDFKAGGRWHYFMLSPEGEKHWCKVDFKSIDPQKSFTAIDSFCDENGVDSHAAPFMHWHTKFQSAGNGTLVTVEVSFDSAADLEKIVAMGFQQGFTMAHGNLDELLAQ
jgi:uncharacterized protein YndB with AHSA1/START domain